jgi:GNAT superfamily N-acetyltransferase
VGPPEVALRPLDASLDRAQLVAFSCRDFGEPWTDVVEEMIRYQLADWLTLDVASGLAACRGPAICGVAAYSFDRDAAVCHNHVLAVSGGHRRRGYGRLLKSAVLDAARSAGMAAVYSRVDFDNDPMIGLNLRLGANIVRVPGDPDYVDCVIRLP